MSLKQVSFVILLLLVMVSCADKSEFSQWRGPDRNGKYPQTGLLKQWPDDGPELLWFFEGLGEGHGSPGIAEDRLYILGMPDTTGIIYCFDLKGNQLWQRDYGPEWHTNYTGPRSTPTIMDGLLYFVSGRGVAFCMDAENGKVIWKIDMFDNYGAQETAWGIAESPLLDGDRIILTPGGPVHNVVALDRFTGELIWSGSGNGEQSAYCSPILVQHHDARLIVTMTAESVLGIDAANGQTLWRIPHNQGNKIHANSPVYKDGRVFCASDWAKTTKGHVMIQLSEDGKTGEVGWRNEERFNLLGGIILHEGSLYSSSFDKKEWYCLDAATGQVNYVSDQVAGGALIFADGLFYCYGTDGVMALIEANENGCRVISSFEISLGSKEHWAHPVIGKGVLYLRHGNTLMAYDISAASSQPE
jgi:outer membrane protein assembly factor BamB